MSWCVLEECVKDNYYARFHTAITAIENCTLILDWTLNHWSMKYRSRAPGHGACSKSDQCKISYSQLSLLQRNTLYFYFTYNFDKVSGALNVGQGYRFMVHA